MDATGGALGLGTSLAGLAVAQSDKNNARLAAQSALEQWISLNIPDPQQQQLALQTYQQTGQLTPAFQQAVKANPTSFQNITTNPALRGAQMNALDTLQNEGMSGGLTLADQATLQDQLNNTNASAKGRNDAITSSFAQRGMGGSGLELSAKLQNAQNATQNQGMNSLNAAAAARARALSSVMGAGQLGGQIEQQDYGEKANLARAQDSINAFNTRNLQDVNNRNVDIGNAAQQYNVQEAQKISDANTSLKNQEQQYNKSLAQQQYEDQLQKTSGAANAEMGQANFLGNQAKQTGQTFAGIGSGLSKVYDAYSKSNKDKSNQSDDEEEGY